MAYRDHCSYILEVLDYRHGKTQQCRLLLWAQRLEHAAHMLRCPPLQVASRVWEASHSTSEAVNGLSAQQGLRGRFNGLFADYAAATLHIMWQHDICAVAQFIKECMDKHGGFGPRVTVLKLPAQTSTGMKKIMAEQ